MRWWNIMVCYQAIQGAILIVLGFCGVFATKLSLEEAMDLLQLDTPGLQDYFRHSRPSSFKALDLGGPTRFLHSFPSTKHSPHPNSKTRTPTLDLELLKLLAKCGILSAQPLVLDPGFFVDARQC